MDRRGFFGTVAAIFGVKSVPVSMNYQDLLDLHAACPGPETMYGEINGATEFEKWKNEQMLAADLAKMIDKELRDRDIKELQLCRQKTFRM